MLRVRSREQGFSLIELLTVIAIIAILAAMIFPAMKAVKDRANQTKCMANMMNIAKAVKMYKLDNRKFPESLAYRSTTQPPAGMMFERYLQIPTPGVLSGDYSMKTLEVFRCPSSKNGDFASTTTVVGPAGGNLSMKDSTGTPVDALYFTADDYDIQRDGANWTAKYVYEWARQQSDVNALAPDPNIDPNTAALAEQEDYKRQLKWRDPPDDTVLTWCSNHSNGTKDVVIFLGGTARPVQHTTLVASKWRVRIPRL